jgi:hypothetical protein
MSGETGHRPSSLLEVAAWTARWDTFGLHLKDFLHVFEKARREGRPLRDLLVAPPRNLAAEFAGGEVCDAFLAATADYLSRKNGIPPPAWALCENLVLDQPWFSETYPAVRMRLLRDTPSAFKDKNLFVFESALQVA